MAIDRPGNGDEQDFEDDVFDAEGDFTEDNFEDEAFDEAGYDAELENAGDEEFDENTWDDEAGYDDAVAAPPREQKKFSKSTAKKKFLNFNTIVIAGAVIVGGAVMFMTIQNKSAEVAGGQNIFQSMLNIAGVMDGTLFGEKDDPAAPPQGQVADTGFLNDPSALNAPVPGTENPPQPIPLSPEEGGVAQESSPITPLPQDMAMAEIPRGPEDGLPTDSPIEGNAPPANPAEALLKEAMQNRAEKQNQNANTEGEKAQDQNPSLPVAQSPLPETVAPVQEPVAAAPASPASPVAAETPAPVQTPPPGPDPATQELIAANTKTMEQISGTLSQISGRIEKIDADIMGVKQRQEEDIKAVRASIDELRNDLTDLKNRPVPEQKTETQKQDAVAAPKRPVPAPVPEKADETVEQAAPPVKKAKPASVKPRQTAVTAPANSGRWELRAAQPGRAWISRAGQRDMQSVQVGQEVPGLGRVTSISYQNGRWSVVGTTGRLDQ